MARTIKMLGISGSLRRDSYNTLLLDSARRALPAGVEFERWTGLGELPAYDEDRDIAAGAGPAVAALREAIARADAVLFVTPEYNGTIPGGLKNAVDWASRPQGEAALRGKPVAAIGASTGQFGGVWAQADLRRALGIAGARVVDMEFAVPRAHEVLAEHGDLAAAKELPRLRAVLAELAAQARISAGLRDEPALAESTTSAAA